MRSTFAGIVGTSEAKRPKSTSDKFNQRKIDKKVRLTNCTDGTSDVIMVELLYIICSGMRPRDAFVMFHSDCSS